MTTLFYTPSAIFSCLYSVLVICKRGTDLSQYCIRSSIFCKINYIPYLQVWKHLVVRWRKTVENSIYYTSFITLEIRTIKIYIALDSRNEKCWHNTCSYKLIRKLYSWFDTSCNFNGASEIKLRSFKRTPPRPPCRRSLAISIYVGRSPFSPESWNSEKLRKNKMEEEEKARESWDTSALQSKWFVKWLQKAVTRTPEVVAAFLNRLFVCFFSSSFVSTEINISS